MPRWIFLESHCWTGTCLNYRIWQDHLDLQHGRGLWQASEKLCRSPHISLKETSLFQVETAAFGEEGDITGVRSCSLTLHIFMDLAYDTHWAKWCLFLLYTSPMTNIFIFPQLAYKSISRSFVKLMTLHNTLISRTLPWKWNHSLCMQPCSRQGNIFCETYEFRIPTIKITGII